MAFATGPGAHSWHKEDRTPYVLARGLASLLYAYRKENDDDAGERGGRIRRGGVPAGVRTRRECSACMRSCCKSARVGFNSSTSSWRAWLGTVDAEAERVTSEAGEARRGERAASMHTGKRGEENAARWEPEHGDTRARCIKYTQQNCRPRRSTVSTAKTRIDRASRGPICHGKKRERLVRYPAHPRTRWGRRRRAGDDARER